MKTVQIGRNYKHWGPHEVEVPESYSEAYDMLVAAAHPYFGHGRRSSVAARVAFGLFRPDAVNPDAALNLLLQDLCLNEGLFYDTRYAPETPSFSRRREGVPSGEGGGEEDPGGSGVRPSIQDP